VKSVSNKPENRRTPQYAVKELQDIRVSVEVIILHLIKCRYVSVAMDKICNYRQQKHLISERVR